MTAPESWDILNAPSRPTVLHSFLLKSLQSMPSQVQAREYLHSYRYYIGIAAAVSIVWQQVYYRLFRVPKKLRHIPAIAFSKQIRALLRWEPVSSRTNTLVFPLLPKANGVYLVRYEAHLYKVIWISYQNRMPFDWTIYVANPILAKSVLTKPGTNRTWYA